MTKQEIVSIHGETYRIVRREGGKLYLVKIQVGPRRASNRPLSHSSLRDEMRKREDEGNVSAILQGGIFGGPGLDLALIKKAHALEEENERLERLVQMQRNPIRSNHNPDCSITLKLEAFDAEDGIDSDTLHLMLTAFEELVKVVVRESDKDIDAEIRIVGIRPGCMQVDLLIVLIVTADISIDLNIDPTSLVTNGLGCLFAFLSFRYTKQSAMQKQSSTGKASAGDAISDEWQGELPSSALIRAARRFLEWASSSLKGDVVVAKPPTGKQDDSSGEEALTITPSQIENLIQYSDELDDSEDDKGDEGDGIVEGGKD